MPRDPRAPSNQDDRLRLMKYYLTYETPYETVEWCLLNIFRHIGGLTLTKQKRQAALLNSLSVIILERFTRRKVFPIMARNNRRKDHTFAKIDLTTDERQEFLAWSEASLTDLVSLLATVLTEGYKFSVKYDDENTTWIATLSNTDNARYNQYCSTTSRHSVFEQAILLTLYKHMVISQNQTWRFTPAEADWG